MNKILETCYFPTGQNKFNFVQITYIRTLRADRNTWQRELMFKTVVILEGLS